MEYKKFEIPLEVPVRSLCWSGDSLIDWAGGNRVFDLVGKTSGQKVNWAHRFDAAVQSPSGRYAAIYERLEIVTKPDETVGTMLWLGDGHLVSFYETPKIIDVNNGKVLHRWPDIATGRQDSSIIHHLDRIPTARS